MEPANALTFRDAAKSDLAAIVAMYLDDELGSGREQLADPLPAEYLEAFAEIEARPGTRLIVGDLAGKPVCTFQIDILAGLSRGGTRRLQIEAVRVARRHRGRGIGRSAMEWAIALARTQNCALVQLTTAKSRGSAQRFYLSLGFTASHHGMKLLLSDPPA